MKKKPNWCLRIIFSLFVIYLAIFIVNKNGFYEAKLAKNTILTNEKIKEFEQDLLAGKIVDVNNYFSHKDENYNNKFNEVGERIGASINEILTNGFKNIWQIIKILFI